jgi:Spy/CpxP family protein refolding chaperone
MFLRRKLIGVAVLVVSPGLVALAQQPSTQSSTTPQGPDVRQERMQRMEKHRDRMGRRMDGRMDGGIDGPGGRREHLGIMRELNLTDEQKRKQRTIMQNHFAATKSQREELFKLREKRLDGSFNAEDATRARALHEEIRNSMQGIRQQMDEVLTPEQRTKLEELRKERRAKHQEMRERQQSPNNITPR